jgi:hypothetical protein
MQSNASFSAKFSEYETAKMRYFGYRPSIQAGNATDAEIDFSDRGGIVMMRRRISPRAIRSNW